MWPDVFSLGYIDPNTSQHVFSLFGPILAFLGVTGGLIATVIVCVRHRIASYFRKASRVRRVTTLCFAIGAVAIMAAIIWWILC